MLFVEGTPFFPLLEPSKGRSAKLPREAVNSYKAGALYLSFNIPADGNIAGAQ